MIIYRVQVSVVAELAHRWEQYMRGEHIADVLATGCFVSARFMRMAEGAEGEVVFETEYAASHRADLDTYVAHHAERLRGHHNERFADGVRASRSVFQVVQVFGEGAQADGFHDTRL